MIFRNPKLQRVMRFVLLIFAAMMFVLMMFQVTRGSEGAGVEAASGEAVLAAAGVAAAAATVHAASVPADVPRVFILGIDGMDPRLLQEFAAKGRMPTFTRLMREGSYSPFESSTPPQSPVAWSNFITGQDPGGHGIFDFIHRDPDTYLPEFSASLVEEPEKKIALGSWEIPLSKGKVELLRKGAAFWQILGDHDIPCTIFRIPSNFPPVHSKAKAISGMGTPDLLGSYGTFSFFSDDPSFVELDVSGGKIFPVHVTGNIVASHITGPENTLKKDKKPLTVPFEVDIDRASKAAKLTIDGQELILNVGEFSDWVKVTFDIVGPLHTVEGICRFYLKSIEPFFALYASPVNINPANPALPISEPAGYIEWLYRKIGYHYTQGMPEDTKAYEWGVLSEAEFLRQTHIVFGERMKMLDAHLKLFREEGGMMFFYISTLDQSTHMLWRDMDPNHPGHSAESAPYQGAIEDLYVRMDSVLAVVESRLPAGTTLIVMSDHGFSPFYKKFDLNTWLFQNGYIDLQHPSELTQHHIFGDVYWRRTKAYALGINGLYVNLKGREKKGVVREGTEYEELVKELTDKLLAIRDPETGEQVIGNVYRTGDIYHGPEKSRAPDLIVGYKRGYRSSDASALGNFSKEIFTPNTGKWSGDHCMATEEVPGVVLSNRPITKTNPALVDIAPTLLTIYGITPPADMVGGDLFGAAQARTR